MNVKWFPTNYTDNYTKKQKTYGSNFERRSSGTDDKFKIEIDLLGVLDPYKVQS